MKNEKTLKQLKNDYLLYLKNEKNRSSLTVRNYDLYLERFLDFLIKNKILYPSKLNNNNITVFYEQLGDYFDKNKRSKLKKTTKNYHLIAIRGFIKYLFKNEYIKFDEKDIDLVKVPRKKADFLNEADCDLLIEAPIKFNNSKIIQQRDKALLEVIRSTGFRVSQVSLLQINDFDKIKKTLNLNKNKYILSNQAVYWLASYLASRKDNIKYLFIGHDRALQKRKKLLPIKGLSARSIERIIERYAKLIGLKKKVTPQILRYNYARKLLLSGESPESIKEKMGYTSASFVNFYK